MAATIEQLQEELQAATERADDLQRQLEAAQVSLAMRSVRADGSLGRTFRVYLDRDIDLKKNQGGEHSRVLDLEVETEEEARAEAEKQLRRGEVVNQVVGVTFATDLG